MAITLSIANQKGGVGKTTTAEQLAVEIASAGYRTHVLDMDPQASFTRWHKQREKRGLNSFTVGTVQPGLLEDELFSLKSNPDLDIVLIDCPGNIEDITRRALESSDGVVCPVRATALDIESTKVMARAIKLLQQTRDTRLMVFHNAKHSNRRLDRDAFQALVRIFEPGEKVFVLQTAITDTAAIAESGMTGQALIEYAPKSPSARSYRKLTKEILECLRPASA